MVNTLAQCLAEQGCIYYICYNQTSLQSCLRLPISSYHGDQPVCTPAFVYLSGKIMLPPAKRQQIKILQKTSVMNAL